MLREIEAEPPFESVDELIALTAALGKTHIHIMLSTADAGLAAHLVEHGHGTANLSVTSAARGAALACAEFARQHIASYFEAQHDGVSLRVWPDQTWVDGLRSAPIGASVSTHTRRGTTETRYSVKTLGIDRSLEVWLAAADGPVTIHARSVKTQGLAHLLQAVGTDAIKIDSTLSCSDALALSKAHPRLPMSWAAGDLHMELPEFTARRFPKATNSGEERSKTLELFRSVRVRPTLVGSGDVEPG